MRTHIGVLILLAGFSSVPAWAQSQLVNGSFESGPPVSSNDITIPAGSSAIDGWTVTGTSAEAIDYCASPWDVSDGVRAIDLDGRDSVSGGIEQTFSTLTGQTYIVAFDLSGNPHGLPTVKGVRVTVDGYTQDYWHDSSGQSITSLIWQTVRFSFVASGSSATLSFTSLTGVPNSYGAMIDNVIVVPGFTFRGFFSPIDNLPSINVMRAGAAVPVKFSLDGDQGLEIFAAGYPASQPMACDTFALTATVEETVAPGKSGLTYDPILDEYTYVWKTERGWSNTCRQLVLRLADGSYHVASFKFVR